MLQTVEAEIDIDDNVRLLEPLRVTRKARAIVTVLEESNGGAEKKGNLKKILELLKSPEVANRKSFSAEEIETQIEEARNS
jgi:exonuclease V gamma subunit